MWLLKKQTKKYIIKLLGENMKRTISSFNKFCATCAYWTGPRTVENMGIFVETQDDNAKGKCMAPFGTGWRLQDRTPLSTCSGYKKWEVLR